MAKFLLGAVVYYQDNSGTGWPAIVVGNQITDGSGNLVSGNLVQFSSAGATYQTSVPYIAGGPSQLTNNTFSESPEGSLPTA